MMVDPNAAATLSVDQIWRLADDMVQAHGALLPAALREPLALRPAPRRGPPAPDGAAPPDPTPRPASR
jgi:hypothetical protein